MTTRHFDVRLTPHPLRWFASLCLMVVTLCACQTSGGGELDQSKPKFYRLSVVAYNYTDEVIGDFDIDGVGGGLIGISNHHSGGGGTLCCARWRDGTRLPVSYHVRWVADICEFTTPPNRNGETFETIHQFYKEADIDLQGPIPAQPAYLGVHFYPDGHIELALTEKASFEPRLKLDPYRRRQSKRCTEDDLKR